MVKYLLAIDLGATKILAGILDEKLNVIKDATAPSRTSIAGLADPGLTATKEVIADLIDYAAEADIEISAGGIGFPEYVSQNRLLSKDCVSWEIQPELELPDLTGFAWSVESDVRCAALGESMLGAGAGSSDFIYLTISTGISHTFMHSGKPWPGANGRAIGFGVTRIAHEGDYVMLESIASGLGIAREYQHRSGKNVSSAVDVFDCYETEPIALEVINTGAEVLAQGIVNLVEIFDPAKIVIGGGLWLGSAKYRSLITAGLPEPVVEIIESAKLPNAGLIGAAVAARQLLTSQ